MIGYCAKDAGLPHYAERVKNVTIDDVARGITEYGHIRTNYEKERKSITKANIFALAYSFWKNYLTSLSPAPSLVDILRIMLQSGQYTISSSWAFDRGLAGPLSETISPTLWYLITDPTTATRTDVMLIFFGVDTRTAWAIDRRGTSADPFAANTPRVPIHTLEHEDEYSNMTFSQLMHHITTTITAAADADHPLPMATQVQYNAPFSFQTLSPPVFSSSFFPSIPFHRSIFF